MKNTLDVRLSYKQDTGYTPIRGIESSLFVLEFDFGFENNAKPDNEEAFAIAEDAEGALESATGWAEDILQYVDWLEDQLLLKQQELISLQKYKSLKRTKL
jgi:hypothetical protein